MTPRGKSLPLAGPPKRMTAAQLASQSGSLALGWSLSDAEDGTLRFAVESGVACVSVGVASTYGAMSPATVWTVMQASDGTPVLTQHVNSVGHQASNPVALSPGATLLSAALAPSGRLAANFTVPAGVPSVPGWPVVNLIWATCSGNSVQHGTQLGVDFGFASINASCSPTPGDPTGALCVLSSSSHAPDTSKLDVIAGAGAAVTCLAVLLLAAVNAHRRGWAQHARRFTWAHAPTDGQTLLLLGWGATLAAVTAASAALFPASPAHVLGRLLAPAWAAALVRHTCADVGRRALTPPKTQVPVTPRGMLAALGWSFHEAVTAHRVAAATALALTVAHVACALSEVGPAAVALTPVPTPGGRGYVYGAAAFAAAGAAAVVALPPVVRAIGYAAFIAAHATFATLALLLACFHATRLVPYLAIPVFCGALDRLFAWARASGEHTCRIAPLSRGAAVKLQVDSVRWRRGVSPGQWAYVKLENPLPLAHSQAGRTMPAGWHPLSILCLPTSGGGPGVPPDACGTVTFLASGSAFAASAAAAATAKGSGAPQRCFVRVDGPYGRPAVPDAVAARLTSLLLVAGGAGITPCLPCALDMARRFGLALAAGQTAAAHSRSVPPRLALLWVVRHSDALSTWFPGHLERLASCGVAVTCAVTGGEPDDTDGQLQHLAAAGVTLTRGRPDVAAAVRQAAGEGGGAATAAVFVCGPPSLMDDVQTAAAAERVLCLTERFAA